MVLYMIGLGLGDEKDVTVKGLEAIKRSKRVFLEHYTAIIGVSVDRLSAYYECNVELADREMVESGCDEILDDAVEHDVSFLVVGDVFAATTHSDLMLRAVERNIAIRVIHNASIMNAVSACGLQLYNFGQSVSICFFTETWKPDSFYEKIITNRKAGLHTLCLLDIKVKEQSFENMSKGILEYEPPRYMTINQCIEELLEVEEKHQKKAYEASTLCVGLARVGQDEQKIVSGTMEELLKIDFGGPLHSFVIPGELHEVENFMLDHYHWDRDNRILERKAAMQHEEERRARERDEDDKERKTAREAAQEAFRLKKEIEQEETRLRLEQIKLATESAPPTASEESDSDEGNGEIGDFLDDMP